MSLIGDDIENSHVNAVVVQPNDGDDVTVVDAELVDEAAVVAEMDERSREIREQIISNTVIGTAIVEEEKSFVEKYGTFLCTVLIVIVLVVVLSIVLTNKDEKPEKFYPTPSPVTQPISDYDFLVELFTPISGIEQLTSETPQKQALDWVANNDPLFNRTDTFITTQRYILAVLYFSTNGDAWADSLDFLSDKSACEWPQIQEGEFANSAIRCNSQGEINQIIIEYNNLNGTLPMELSQFTALEDLALRGNLLHGTLPSEYGSLVRLEQLDVARNGLISGTIPDTLGGLTELRELALHTNSFVGTIPSKIPLLPKLESFWLHNNLLTGTIPDFPSDSPILSLQLNDNMLHGTLPESVYSLAAVTRLAVHNNPLMGTISNSIALLSNLKSMELNGCSFNGTIPSNIATLSSLNYLGLGSNMFSGTIPSDLGRLVFLEKLVLSYNMLTGTIPSELGMLPNIFSLFLEGNLLTGTVPPELGQISTLRK